MRDPAAAERRAAEAAAKAARLGIRPDQQCATPEENYDITGTLGKRLGTEGSLRLEKLVSTDFKDSTLSKKDHELLKTLSQEMLWVPAPLEEAIGTGYQAYSRGDFTVLDKNDDTAYIWDYASQVASLLLGHAPSTPFTTQLFVISKGAPMSLAGGRVFMDRDTLMEAAEDPHNKAQNNKVTFVMAHELAHIYKRHRAKRLQQVLVDTDAGLKVVRKIFAAATPAKRAGRPTPDVGIGTWWQTALLMPDLYDEFRQRSAKYEQDQELEADACATALMLASGLGEPVDGFQTYVKDQQTHRGGNDQADLYATHPPSAQREANIRSRQAALLKGAPQAPGSNGQRAAADASGRKPPTAVRPDPGASGPTAKSGPGAAR